MAQETSSIKATRRLTETAIMLALAIALSYVKIFDLPMGGSITLFSQAPLIIIGYRYGWKWGATTGVIYGILGMLLQGLGNFAYVKGFVSYLILILADYALAFMVLGIGGAMFRGMKNQTVALGLGALVGSALRFICHFISGITIWGEYADGWASVWQYSAAYNGSYMAAEAVITIIGVVVLSFVLDFRKENLRKTKA
jgi:thiamine transporter